MGTANIFSQKPKKTGLSKKSVIKGDFSSYKINYREFKIYKFNKFMSFGLLILVFLSMVSYMAVVSREIVVKDLHAKTNKIYYENIDLQNSVDNLKSFYSIDSKVSKINFLKKPDKVIELRLLNESGTPKKINKHNNNNIKQVPAGF